MYFNYLVIYYLPPEMDWHQQQHFGHDHHKRNRRRSQKHFIKEQGGLRDGRCTTEQISILRNLKEQTVQ